MARTILSILLAAVWVSASEFFRNEIVLKSYWVNYYKELGLVFPDAPINGAIWGLWSLLFAIAIFALSRRFTPIQTSLLAWFMGFAMMWVAIGNLSVLPYGLLWVATPLSALESVVASFIVIKVSPPHVA